MSSIRNFAGQAVIYGIGSILSKVVYLLLITIYLTYLLGEKGQNQFGIYSILYSYMTVLIVLFSLKLDTALFRFGNKKENIEESYNTTASLVTLSGVLVLCISFIWSNDIAVLIGFPGDGYYVRWFSFILAFDIIALVGYAKLRLQNKAKQFTIFKITNVLVTSLLIIFFLAVYPKYQDSALSWLPKFPSIIDYVFLVNVFVSGIYLLILLYYVKGFKLKISPSLVKKIIPYVIPLVIVGMANNFIQYFGVQLIQFLSDGSANENISSSGVYDASRRVAGFFALFIGAFNYAAEPFFFNNSSVQDKEKMYGKICNIFVLIGGVVCLGLVLFMDILKIALPPSYRESLVIVPILLIAYMLLGVYHNVSIWYKLSDNTIYGAVISVIGALATFIIAFLFIGDLGYSACAWGTLTAYAIMVTLAYVIGQKKYPISYPVGKILLSIVLISILLYVGFYNYQNLTGLKLYSINAGIFIAYLVYVYHMEKDEWKAILKR
jgi:O-antigen/teichoic acid export membrane protein